MADPTPVESPNQDTPYIPASQSLPEITIKALVLGLVLSVVLAAANAYLGLFAGMTVSASIPAAVISMAVLRLFPAGKPFKVAVTACMRKLLTILNAMLHQNCRWDPKHA